MAQYANVSSLEAYIKKITALSAEVAFPNSYLYRGHKSHKFDAVPSVFRSKGWMENEPEMVKSLLADQPNEFTNDLTIFERLVRSQHYGLPTRLLDVTRNPLLALCFACEPASEILKNGKIINLAGEVILFSPSAEKRKFYDSDTITCLSNLALLKKWQIDAIRKHFLDSREAAELLYPDDSEGFTAFIVEEFNRNDEVLRLSQLASIERPGFIPRINPFDLANSIYVQPRKLHPRLAAQDGAFLIFGLFWDFDEYIFLEKVEKIELRIPSDKKAEIRSGLKRLGISDETLFPEIDRSAQQIRDHFLQTAHPPAADN